MTTTKQKVYKMLQLYAKDIYAHTRFDENGNSAKSSYKIYLNDKKNNKALAKKFKGSTSENLDLMELCNKYGEDKIIRRLGGDSYLTALISVDFKGKSSEYSAWKDFNDNKKIYVKRGFDNIENIISNLTDSVYIKDGIIVAVKVDNEIENVNKDVINSKYFKLVEKDNKNHYEFTNSTVGDKKSDYLREDLYKNGFSIKLISIDKNGQEKSKIINYVRYKRSASNARVGNCLFINKAYFEYMNTWSYFDRKEFMYDSVVENQPVEAEAYKALSLSSLKNKIKLEPHNILILKDVESVFEEDCINVKLDDAGRLIANKEKTKIKNTIWDGEGLLDTSVFEANGYSEKGMLLLRNRYFKCCAFNTKLKDWFKDNNITKISQLNGFTKAKSVDDILLIVTESSMKILKFSDSKRKENANLPEDTKHLIDQVVEEFWMDYTGNVFGVVKTDEPTKRFGGRIVQTSYQLLNTLGINKEEVKELIAPSHEYLLNIKNNSSVLKYYLDKEMDEVDDNEFEKEHYDNVIEESSEDTSDYYLEENIKLDVEDDNKEIVDDYNRYKYKICSELLRINPKFENTKLYSYFRTKLLSDIKKKYKLGKILIPGTYATIFGNGYELLLYAIKDKKGKPKFDISKTEPLLKKGEIMCKRIEFDKEVCGARSPHITMGNLYLAKNVEKEEYNKYFNLSKEIVCVNAIGENIQQKLNGMDYDSDTMLVSDYKPIVEAAKSNYEKFLVPVCSVKSENKKGKISLDSIDHKIANNYIGRIVNLSQHLNSILWDIYNKEKRIDEDIYLKICKLAVLSGMEIDKAKRDYNVDSLKEYNEINKWVKNSNYKNSPRFRERKEKKTNKKYNIEKEYMDYETTMDYISLESFNTGGRKDNKVELYDILNKKCISKGNGSYSEKAEKIDEYIKEVNDKLDVINKKHQNDKHDDDYIKNNRKKNEEIKKELDYFYSKVFKLITHPYTIYLFLKKEVSKEEHLWPLLYALYVTKPTKEDDKNKYNNLLERFFISETMPKKLVEDEKGDINLFGFTYKEE